MSIDTSKTICGIPVELLAKEPTATELAYFFSEMNDLEQAQFFNELAQLAKEWGKPACMQWHSIEQHLTPGGAQVVCDIAGI